MVVHARLAQYIDQDTTDTVDKCWVRADTTVQHRSAVTHAVKQLQFRGEKEAL